MRNKFIIFPILKYFNIKKRVTANAITIFLLRLFEKIETVKKIEEKTRVKNIGTAPIAPGSVNKIINVIDDQRRSDIRISDIFIVSYKFFFSSCLLARLSSIKYNYSMDLIIILATLIIGFIVLGYLINRKQKPSNDILEYLKTTNTRLDQQGRNFNDRLDNATHVISQVQRNIGEMSEIGRSMKDLQEFLQSPKLRGNVGEQVLKELLGQSLPKSSFNLQYEFKSGAKVDAAIKTAAGIIPIDSKFPMENFRKMSNEKGEHERKIASKNFEQDVRKHIDDIARKYILTDEGTIDYALMYIPSEAVYYEIVNNLDLFEYSNKMRVLPVSPTTFYAYMRAILMSFEGQKIEDKAKEILATLRAVKKDYEKVEGELGILQKHLNSAYNKMGDVFNSFGRLGSKIDSTNNLEIDKKSGLE